MRFFPEDSGLQKGTWCVPVHTMTKMSRPQRTVKSCLSHCVKTALSCVHKEFIHSCLPSMDNTTETRSLGLLFHLEPPCSFSRLFLVMYACGKHCTCIPHTYNVTRCIGPHRPLYSRCVPVSHGLSTRLSQLCLYVENIFFNWTFSTGFFGFSEGIHPLMSSIYGQRDWD